MTTAWVIRFARVPQPNLEHSGQTEVNLLTRKYNATVLRLII